MFNLRARLTNFLLMFLIPFVTVAFLALATYRGAMRLILRRLRERGMNTKKLILVGLSPVVDQLLDKITSHLFYGYEVIGVFGPRSSAGTRFPHLGEIDDFMDQLEQYCPDEVIIALPFEFSPKLPDLITACELQGVQAKVIDSLASALGTRGHVDDIGGIRLVSAHPTRRRGWITFVFKRLFDIVASFFLLVLLTPLMFLIALGVKCSSKDRFSSDSSEWG